MKERTKSKTANVELNKVFKVKKGNKTTKSITHH